MLYPFASAPRPRLAVAQAICVSALLHAFILALILSSRPPRLTSVAKGVGEHVSFATLPYSPDAPLRPTARQHVRRSASIRRVQAIRLPQLIHFDDLPQMALPVATFTMVVDSIVSNMRGTTSLGTDDGFDAKPAVANADGDEHDVYTAATVDADATPLPENPKPNYPGELLRRSVEAHFSVYFVVDTTGRVDETTIEVPRSVQSQFASAVTSVLSRWHFFPAQRRGRRVRQLMEQPFIFKIDEVR
jgi:TonB family protein